MLAAMRRGNDGNVLPLRLPHGEQRFAVIRRRRSDERRMAIIRKRLCRVFANGDGIASNALPGKKMVHGIGAGKYAAIRRAGLCEGQGTGVQQRQV